jgi:Fe-S oxidoreductase
LTWISTGQLSRAKKVLRRTVAALSAHVREGGLVLGLEPSCTAVFRSDAADLFPDDQDVARLKNSTVTLAELLTEHTPGWSPTLVDGQPTRKAIAQVHCHQHAITGWDADQAVLSRIGIEAEPLNSGCCGLAGNFGFTAGHGEVSEALAERVLLPRVRAADPDTLVLADGFSCRTQIHDLASAGRDGVHLAEVLAAVTREGKLDAHIPDRRPPPPSRAARQAASATVAAGALAAVAAAARWWLSHTSSQTAHPRR